MAISHDGADIMTIEGIASGSELHPLQAAFIAHDRFQCGFCTPDQIMSALGLIDEGEAGDDRERIREGRIGEGKAPRMKSFGYVRPTSIPDAMAASH